MGKKIEDYNLCAKLNICRKHQGKTRYLQMNLYWKKNGLVKIMA